VFIAHKGGRSFFRAYWNGFKSRLRVNAVILGSLTRIEWLWLPQKPASNENDLAAFVAGWVPGEIARPWYFWLRRRRYVREPSCLWMGVSQRCTRRWKARRNTATNGRIFLAAAELSLPC